MNSNDNQNLPKIIENSGLALHKTRNLLSITDKILKSKMLVTEQQIGKFIIKDGIATDTETGLTWLRFTHGQRWENGNVVGDAERFTWDDAMKIPDTFNQQGYAGYNDWRVPDVDELKTLIDRIKGKKANLEVNLIDADIFPENVGEVFWSSSPCAYSSGKQAWVVWFVSGGSHQYPKSNSSLVRLVR
jgi:hypothetical protein